MPPGAGASLVSDGLDPVIESFADGAFVMTFGDVARFRIGLDDQTVRLISAHPLADQDTIDHLLDDHVAPRVIAAGGCLVLHGSSTQIGSRMVIFLGQTGSGKSTLAASLHANGHRLLGDDAVVISEAEGTFCGETVYPSLRLHRESIDKVFTGSVATSAMAFYSDKLRVSAERFGASPAERFPLAAVYILTEGEEGVSLLPFVPADACMALIENSFALNPHDSSAAAARMRKAAQVAAAVPCYELAYPYDFGLLSEARAQVLASLDRLDSHP